jgi:hypothetical protein
MHSQVELTVGYTDGMSGKWRKLTLPALADSCRCLIKDCLHFQDENYQIENYQIKQSKATPEAGASGDRSVIGG